MVQVEAAIREVEAAGRMLVDAAGVVIFESLSQDLHFALNFIQAGRNLKNGQSVSEVRLPTAQMLFQLQLKALALQVKEVLGGSVQNVKAKLATASQKL